MPAGEDLRAHAVRLLDLERLTIDAMRAHRDDGLGRIRLGSSAALCAHLLPPVLVDLRQRHPSLEVSIVTGATMAMVRQVMANEIDIAFATGPLPPQDPALEIRAILPGAFLALWPDVLGRAPVVVTPDDLAGRPFVSFTPGNLTHDLVQRWFAASGVKPGTMTEIDIGPNIVALVRAGVGASILSPDVALWLGDAANVAVRPTAPPIPHEVLVVTRRDKPRDRALRIVHDALLALNATPTALGPATSG
jgi:DNA-binding transcriptional LysR family regulator